MVVWLAVVVGGNNPSNCLLIYCASGVLFRSRGVPPPSDGVGGNNAFNWLLIYCASSVWLRSSSSLDA